MPRLRPPFAVLGLLSVLLAGCDSNGLDIPLDGSFDFARGHDMAHNGDMAHHGDMAQDMRAQRHDLSSRDDLSTSPCITVDAWTGPNAPYASEEPDNFGDGFDYVVAVYQNDLGLAFGYEYWHPTNTKDPSLPRTKVVSAKENYNDCSDCVVAYTGAPPPLGNESTFYLAQAGTITVTRTDHTGMSGTVTVSGANMHLVQWTYVAGGSTDHAVAGGGCLDVASFSFSTTWAH